MRVVQRSLWRLRLVHRLPDEKAEERTGRQHRKARFLGQFARADQLAFDLRANTEMKPPPGRKRQRLNGERWFEAAKAKRIPQSPRY